MNGKFTLRRNEEFINFPIKEMLILWNSGGKKEDFFQRRKLVER